MAFDFSLVTAPFRMQPGLRRRRAGRGADHANAPGSRHLREKMAVLGSFAAAGALLAARLRRAAGAARRSPRRRRGPARKRSRRCDARGGRSAAKRRCSAGRSTPVGRAATATRPSATLLHGLAPGSRRAALLSPGLRRGLRGARRRERTVPWLAVCLPSHWAPEDKVGRTFAEVHAPVADNALLRAARASLARLVTGDERWERFVWTVSPDPRLHQHPARSDAAGRPPARRADADALAARRVAAQRAPDLHADAGRGQAIFTIRVESLPLARRSRARDARAPAARRDRQHVAGGARLPRPRRRTRSSAALAAARAAAAPALP